MNWYQYGLSVRVQYVICCTLSVFTAHNKSWNPLQKFPDKWILHPSLSLVFMLCKVSVKRSKNNNKQKTNTNPCWIIFFTGLIMNTETKKSINWNRKPGQNVNKMLFFMLHCLKYKNTFSFMLLVYVAIFKLETLSARNGGA